MKRTHVEALLWALALAIGVAAWRQARAVVPPEAAQPAARPAAPPEPLRFSAGQMAQAAGSIARGDPFRLDRRPSPVAFNALPNGVEGGMGMPPAPPPPPRPQLSVSGIVGPPWAALLDGVPGRDGSVMVRAGERVGELTVRRVGPDGVVVVGMDTTWRLSLKRTWQ
ncbi:MAG TPA: hypothetical protein VFJ82_21160 [Longimicrobium sp.]|nr:hypothetical protein [Longimicrobium sp.]